MPIYGNIGGALKEVRPWYANVGGSLKEESSKYANIGGSMKEIYTLGHCFAKYTSARTGASRYTEPRYVDTDNTTLLLTELEVASGSLVKVSYGTSWEYNMQTGTFTLAGTTGSISRMSTTSYMNADIEKLWDKYVLYNGGAYHSLLAVNEGIGTAYLTYDYYYARGSKEYEYKYSFVEYVYDSDPDAYPEGSIENYYGTTSNTVYVKIS